VQRPRILPQHAEEIKSNRGNRGGAKTCLCRGTALSHVKSRPRHRRSRCLARSSSHVSREVRFTVEGNCPQIAQTPERARLLGARASSPRKNGRCGFQPRHIIVQLLNLVLATRFARL